MRLKQAQLKELLLEKNQEIEALHDDKQLGRQVNDRAKLSHALKLISKIRLHEIK
jgi:hypothetical protein